MLFRSIDVSQLMKMSDDDFEHSPPKEESHPDIQGLDVWDTRGIARTIKHNDAARKSDEMKKLLDTPNARQAKPTAARMDERTEKSRRFRAERTNSVSIRVESSGTGSRKLRRSTETLSHTQTETANSPQATPRPSGVREIDFNSAPSLSIERPGPKPAQPAAQPAKTRPAPPPQAQPRPPGQTHSAPTAPTTVQAASRANRREGARPPTIWTMEMLKGGPDPLGRGLAILLEKGAESSLFLAITPPPPGARIPHFIAAASARPTAEKVALWTGLRWDPATVPDVWNQLLKSGYIEFHPPGQITNIGSRRNTIRAAFGPTHDEVLTLIRVGPVAACRGILAIYSDRTMIMELGPILTLFNTPLPLHKTG